MFSYLVLVSTQLLPVNEGKSLSILNKLKLIYSKWTYPTQELIHPFYFVIKASCYNFVGHPQEYCNFVWFYSTPVDMVAYGGNNSFRSVIPQTKIIIFTLWSWFSGIRQTFVAFRELNNGQQELLDVMCVWMEKVFGEQKQAALLV